MEISKEITMKKLLFLLAISSLVLAACGAQARSLVGGWKLTSYGPENSPTPAVAESQASLTLNPDGTITGNSGCNGFGGEYKVDGDQITFTGLVSTLMACTGPLMEQEGAMFRVLNGTADYKIDGDMLTITKDGTVLVFASSQVQSYPYP